MAELERTWAIASAHAAGVSLRKIAAAAGLGPTRIHAIVREANLDGLDAIEVSGALVRAARVGRGDQRGLLELLDADLAGPVVVLSAAQEQVEQDALTLVRDHGVPVVTARLLATQSRRGATRGAGQLS